MTLQTTEKAFESWLERMLLDQSGWQAGSLDTWDKERALFPAEIFAFLLATQPRQWAELLTEYGSGLESSLISGLVKELDAKGSLSVLRHGFKFHGQLLRLAYFKPAHKGNDETLLRYTQNRLTVTRQVPCHPNDHKTLDMVLALNGIPVVTVELKNPGTGQTWKQAIHQYRTDRDPRAPLFEFKKRALVHFAVDPSEVYMTTRLAGDKTWFLPFNRGSHPGQVGCGKGNPQHPSGYRSGYLWEDVLARDSFMDIVGHFLFLEKKNEKVDDGKGGHKLVQKETLVFPRFHQLDAVRRLVAAAATEGAGRSYLIQHSAGSGKTNSISWLSHRLASLHDHADEKVFDCVLVITDRQVLDRQLQDAIYQIEHAQGVVKAIDRDSKQLAEALVDGTRIVITTLQKFPFVLKSLLRNAGASSLENASAEERAQARAWEAALSKRRYAIIVDEAHSSQSGESAKELKALLGVSVAKGSSAARSALETSAEQGAQAHSDDDSDGLTWEDGLTQAVLARGAQKNLSFFAFTATPKARTLEVFGRTGPSGLPEPFHLYSMRQAIEEAFILDVVKNYTTYKTFYRLVQALPENPDLPKKQAIKTLARAMSLHPHSLLQKVKLIVEHYRQKVMGQLGGRAKAMVVTSSRLHAVRYLLAFRQYLEEQGYSTIRPLVAFSGTVKDPRSKLEYTESGMNLDVVTGQPIGEKQLAERFASQDYHILLVANKYQTGFDQPLLQAMYVDKRLDGVQAVQTLSRLNRMVPGKGTPFVLDFTNEAEDIYKAFRPYYDATRLQEKSDPQQLETLKTELNDFQVYFWSEVEAFARIFYKRMAEQSESDHARMIKHLQPAVDRFRALDDDAKRVQFRDKLSAYVVLYSFLSQVMGYPDRELEMLYSFGHPLLPYLREGGAGVLELDDSVQLRYFRLQHAFSGAIDLAEGDGAVVKGPTEVGSSAPKDEKASLSEIVALLNERFGTQFKEEDRLFFEQIREKALQNDQVVKTALANPLDKFTLGIKKLVEDLMIQRLAENDTIVTKYMDDQAFQSVALPVLARAIFEGVRGRLA